MNWNKICMAAETPMFGLFVRPVGAAATLRQAHLSTAIDATPNAGFPAWSPPT